MSIRPLHRIVGDPTLLLDCPANEIQEFVELVEWWVSEKDGVLLVPGYVCLHYPDGRELPIQGTVDSGRGYMIKGYDSKDCF